MRLRLKKLKLDRTTKLILILWVIISLIVASIMLASKSEIPVILTAMIAVAVFFAVPAFAMKDSYERAVEDRDTLHNTLRDYKQWAEGEKDKDLMQLDIKKKVTIGEWLNDENKKLDKIMRDKAIEYAVQAKKNGHFRSPEAFADSSLITPEIGRFHLRGLDFYAKNKPIFSQ